MDEAVTKSSLAAEFIDADPRQRIRILQTLDEAGRKSMLKEAAKLGYAPAVALFGK